MLDWEENVFLGLKALHRRFFVAPGARRLGALRATLKEHRGRLALLAHMIAGGSVPLFETDTPGLCGGGRIFLPKEFSVGATKELNDAFYELKTIIAALALRPGRPRSGLSVPALVAEAEGDLPGLGFLVLELDAALPGGLWGHLGTPRTAPGAAASAGLSVALDDMHTAMARQHVTELEGKGQADVEVSLAPDGDGPGAETPIHTFEKAETLEEANGLSRKTDDEDELAEHEEALQSLNLQHLQRSAERPRSIYRSELILDGLALEVGSAGRSGGLPYPEWDFRRREYRADWCCVQPERVVGTHAAWLGATELKHRALIRRLRRQFASVVANWERLHRQPVGAEFDLDAVVDAEVARRSGHTGAEALYLDRHRARQDVAALVLLDQSYSTDAWLDNARVLETISGTVFCAGEVLDEYIDSFAVAAFSSNTRRACRFSELKGFREPWAAARSRFGALEPMGYTRIGPALRHAQALLEREAAQRKIILLITDGRPCDYDRYEGDYGIHDVKKAIETGAQRGIATHAFAIDRQAREFFPRMFSPRQFDIIPKPDRLTGALCQVFARVVAS